MTEKPRRRPGWSANVYACADGTRIACRRETIRDGKRTVPRNGVWPTRPPQLVVAGTVLNRAATEVVRGESCRTCFLPMTTAAVRENAFRDAEELRSVRLDEGLRTLENACF